MPPKQYAARDAPREQRVTGRVARKYDEGRKLHSVRADFEIANGVQLTLVGAPAAELGDILVQLDARVYKLRDPGCGALEILVNDEPTSGSGFSATERSSRITLAARFQFEHFKPLAKKFPNFGTRLCRQEFALTDDQVALLQRFLVIYSELAGEVVQQKQAQEAQDTKPAGEVAPAEGLSL